VVDEVGCSQFGHTAITLLKIFFDFNNLLAALMQKPERT
jgi:hypothetical protein